MNLKICKLIAIGLISLSSLGCSAQSPILPEYFRDCQVRDRELYMFNIPVLAFKVKDNVARQKVKVKVMHMLGDRVEYIAWKNPLPPYGWYSSHANSLRGADYIETPEGRLVDRLGRIYNVTQEGHGFIAILMNDRDQIAGYGSPNAGYSRISNRCLEEVNPSF